MDNLTSLFRRKGATYRFEELVSPYMDILYRQAYQYTGNQVDAEDLLQELLIQLYPQADRLEQIESLKPWLLRCLYNRFVDGYRKKQRQPVIEDLEASGVEGSLESSASAESHRVHQEINRALHALSPAHRAVVCLHDIEGYSLPELAVMLDQPLGTLKSNLHRARKQLKSQLSLQPSESVRRVKAMRG